MWAKQSQEAGEYLVEAVQVEVVLEMDIVGFVLVGFVLVGSGLEESGPGGWEFDQDTLQVPGQVPGQECAQDMELGRCRVCRDPLGHDQVPPLHRSHQVSGCTVSGTPLKWACEKQQEVRHGKMRTRNLKPCDGEWPHLILEWGTFQGWTHQTSIAHYHSSTALWSTAASFGWRSARSAR